MDHPRIQGPAQQIGYSTSIEIARKQTYDACAVSGIKRPYVQLNSECPSVGDNHVLTEGVNIASKRSDFKRPCIGFPAERRFKASRIQNVTAVESEIPQVSEYTQRRALPCTPGPSQNPLLSLSNSRYGLPEHLVRNFASLGINSIYPWQSSCLLGRGLLSGEKNLAVSVLAFHTVWDHCKGKARSYKSNTIQENASSPLQNITPTIPTMMTTRYEDLPEAAPLPAVSLLLSLDQANN